MHLRPRGDRRSVLAALVGAAIVLGTAAPASAAEPPVLTGLAPAAAPVGASVALTGTGLAGTTGVTFSGVAATFSVTDDAHVTATVPSAPDGPVVVTTPDGTASQPFDVQTSPPGAVTGLLARAGDRVVQLTWTTPSGAVAAVVRRAEGATAPASPTDGTAVVGDQSGLVDGGLVNGTAYSYSVWSRDASGTLGPVVSVAVTPAVPVAPLLRIGLSAATVTHGVAVAVTGVLARADGTPVVGRQITLLVRPRGAATFSGTAGAVTDPTGAVRFTYRVLGHSDLLLRDAGDAFSGEAHSLVAGVQARHGLTSRLTTSVVELGGTALVEGRTGPAVSGVVVRLERRVGTAWSLVSTSATDVRGGFRFAARPTAAGEQVLRVVTAGDTRHLAAAGVPLRLVALARTLRAGMSGADVLAVEHRLADLRYDVGPIGGVFDYDTRLAVMAFQKVQGLPRTGVADVTTRARLGTPLLPQLRHPVRGLSVEIDLAKQVLYFSRDGVVQRILPVSSGNNALYTVDGITSRAVTPVGSFRVQRKINGVRVSRLGQLYQPAYFIGGYAIHGSPSVPGFPASHGCIRVTRPAMARLFPLLPVGTPVWVYRA